MGGTSTLAIARHQYPGDDDDRHRHPPYDRQRRRADRMASRHGDGTPGLLPPITVVLAMQRWFVKGLIEPEK